MSTLTLLKMNASDHGYVILIVLIVAKSLELGGRKSQTDKKPKHSLDIPDIFENLMKFAHVKLITLRGVLKMGSKKFFMFVFTLFFLFLS